VTQKRTNWNTTENKAKLIQAIAEWNGKEGRAFDENGKKRSLTVFSFHVEIPHATLKRYVAGDEAKRRKVGGQVGRKSLLTPEDQLLLAHVIENEGLKPAEAIDMVQEMIPTLPRTAAKRHLQRTLLRKHPTVIKGKPVVAQANTVRFIRVAVEKLRETDVLLGRFL
jgi:hypothetical protein